MTKPRKIGDEIVEAFEQLRDLEQGKTGGRVRVHRVARTARDSTVAAAPEYPNLRVSKLRARLKLSQPLFAQALNVSAETVRAWEQGKRRPDGAALRLLQITEKHPSLLLSMVREKPATPYDASRRAR
ncbi:MAG: helix-turn-helix domain-containing protein [Gemmatimonadaceae bacterium]